MNQIAALVAVLRQINAAQTLIDAMPASQNKTRAQARLDALAQDALREVTQS